MISKEFDEKIENVERKYSWWKLKIDDPNRETFKKMQREMKREILEDFRVNLEEEYGLVNNPKSEKVWNMAWEHAHSDSLCNVEIWYIELAELVR